METYKSLFSITDSTFSDNTVQRLCGVIYAVHGFFSARSSIFTNNSVTYDGGVIDARTSSFNISNSTFTNNSATDCGGVMVTDDSKFNNIIIDGTFTSNSAVILCINQVLLNFDSYCSTFYTNKTDYGGIMVAYRCPTHIANGTFNHNLGSLYVFNSNLTIIYQWQHKI